MQTVDVDAVVRELRAMTVPLLATRYAEVFGEPARSRNKQFLIKRIVWKVQALREGGLSERARRRAAELAAESDLRQTAPRARPPTAGPVITASFTPHRHSSFPKPGAVLRREYKGRTLVVRVLHKGFEFEGEHYRSLTAIAQKVTGAHWNGVNFFGLPSAKSSRSRHGTEA